MAMEMTALLIVLDDALAAYKRTNNELKFLGVLADNGYRIVPIDPKEVEEARAADEVETKFWMGLGERTVGEKKRPCKTEDEPK